MEDEVVRPKVRVRVEADVAQAPRVVVAGRQEHVDIDEPLHLERAVVVDFGKIEAAAEGEIAERRGRARDRADRVIERDERRYRFEEMLDLVGAKRREQDE